MPTCVLTISPACPVPADDEEEGSDDDDSDQKEEEVEAEEQQLASPLDLSTNARPCDSDVPLPNKEAGGSSDQRPEETLEPYDPEDELQDGDHMLLECDEGLGPEEDERDNEGPPPASPQSPPEPAQEPEEAPPSSRGKGKRRAGQCGMQQYIAGLMGDLYDRVFDDDGEYLYWHQRLEALHRVEGDEEEMRRKRVEKELELERRGIYKKDDDSDSD